MNADLIFGKNEITFQSNLTPTRYPFIFSYKVRIKKLDQLLLTLSDPLWNGCNDKSRKRLIILKYEIFSKPQGLLNDFSPSGVKLFEIDLHSG